MAKADIKEKKLYRSRKDKIIFGVCGGIAEYLGIDSTLIRILAVILLLSGSWFVVLYILLGIIIPENPNEKEQPAKGDMKNKYLILGGAFVAIGVILLLNNYNIINWNNTWPILLIALGVYLLWQNQIKEKKK
ncbi:PspC domain protein [Candidatus Tiddalikarchaeum anstoanum]|nr:PspC domain protein [Candidatus Tiddalikarchaeum anstoanum]